MMIALTDDDRAALYGAFLTVAAKLQGPDGAQALQLLLRKGKRAFEEGQDPANTVEELKSATSNRALLFSPRRDVECGCRSNSDLDCGREWQSGPAFVFGFYEPWQWQRIGIQRYAMWAIDDALEAVKTSLVRTHCLDAVQDDDNTCNAFLGRLFGTVVVRIEEHAPFEIAQASDRELSQAQRALRAACRNQISKSQIACPQTEGTASQVIYLSLTWPKW